MDRRDFVRRGSLWLLATAVVPWRRTLFPGADFSPRIIAGENLDVGDMIGIISIDMETRVIEGGPRMLKAYKIQADDLMVHASVLRDDRILKVFRLRG